MVEYTLEYFAEIGAHSVQVARYSAISVYTLQLYEWLLTFEEERRLIHQAPWTTVKINFLMCRYYPLLVFPIYIWFWVCNHDRDYCARVVRPLYILMVPFQLSAQAVILIRAYAFTGRRKTTLVFLWSCFVSVCIAQFWLFSSQFILVEELYLILGRSGCYANDRQVEKFAFIQGSSLQTGFVLLGTFLLDFLMMAIVLLHCIRIRSTQGRLGRLFLAQAASVFVVMSILNLLVAVIYFNADRQYDGLGFPFVMVLPDIFACRLILLLREKASARDTPDLKEQSRMVREAFEALKSLPQNDWDIGGSCELLIQEMSSSVLDQLANIREQLEQSLAESTRRLELMETRVNESTMRREDRDMKYDEIRQQLSQTIAAAGRDDDTSAPAADEMEQILQLIKDNHRDRMDDTASVLEQCKRAKRGFHRSSRT